MNFPFYAKYVAMVATRDHVVLMIACCSLFVCTFLLYVRKFRPGWFKPATWLVGVGGFYATLAYWAYFCFTHPAG